MNNAFSVEEWLEEVRKAESAQVEGETAKELLARTKIGQKQLFVLLHYAKSIDRLSVSKRRIETVDGRTSLVPVYKFLPAKRRRPTS